MSSTASKNVLILGPGLVGWNFLDLLVAEAYTVTGLVRRKEHSEGIEKSGAIAILGDPSDHDLIVRHVVESDIIIHTATADHLASGLAILTGVKQRASSAKPTIYIHTSGSSVLASTPSSTPSRIYTDTDPDAINALPDETPDRLVDVAIIRASKELGEKAKMAIIIPPEIDGFGKKHERLSIRILTLTRFALVHGFAGHVGSGLVLECQIHFQDLARAYVVLLHHIENAPRFIFLANPYFFCENGSEFSWKFAAKRIGEALKKRGLVDIAEPREFIVEHDWYELFGEPTGAYLGMSSRCWAVRLRELGWESKEKDIWQSLEEDELPHILSEQK